MDTKEGLGGKASRLRELAQNTDKIDTTKHSAETSTNASDTFELPKTISEKKSNWNFSLLPSTREKITQVARARGYKSDSKFLEDMFKNIE